MWLQLYALVTTLQKTQCELEISTLQVMRDQAKAKKRHALKQEDFVDAVKWQFIGNKLNENLKETGKRCRR